MTTDTANTFADAFEAMCARIGRVVRGKEQQIDLAVACLVADGHLLIEDVPGVGKTTLAKALARAVDGTFGRVQFTPDLLPSDVLGTSVWNPNDGKFTFRPGPVFANLLLADEINRASPKAQAALLEAMAEEQVTVDGRSSPLARPFMVIATQNPVEHHGTYPLPESQLDRFLMRLSLGYPGRAEELGLLNGTNPREELDALEPVLTCPQVLAMRKMATRVHVAEPLANYLVDLADATRSHPRLALGMSTRALLGLRAVIRVRAAAEGRTFATPDDVKAVAEPVLAHRLVVTSESLMQGRDSSSVLDEILSRVPIPGGPS